MGLIQAFTGSISSSLADQWKEYFACDILPDTILMKRGFKVINGKASNNGNDNIISNGSKIVLYDNQAAIITDNGQIVDFISQPGGYEFNKSSQPSIFLDKNIGENFKKIVMETWDRFKYAGQPSNEQRIFFFNLKEIPGFTFGSSSGPLDIGVVSRVDKDITQTVGIKYNGKFSLRIVDVIRLYKNVIGAANEYTRDQFRNNYFSEIDQSIREIISQFGDEGIITTQTLIGNSSKLSKNINDKLSEDWIKRRGVDIESFAITIIADSKDMDELKKVENAASARRTQIREDNNANMNAAFYNASQHGSAGIIGLGLGAGMMGGGIQQGMIGAGMMRQPQQIQEIKCPNCGAMNPANSKFCPNCGSKLTSDTWKCECGTENSSNYCSNCGKKKPE